MEKNCINYITSIIEECDKLTLIEQSELCWLTDRIKGIYSLSEITDKEVGSILIYSHILGTYLNRMDSRVMLAGLLLDDMNKTVSLDLRIDQKTEDRYLSTDNILYKLATCAMTTCDLSEVIIKADKDAVMPFDKYYETMHKYLAMAKKMKGMPPYSERKESLFSNIDTYCIKLRREVNKVILIDVAGEEPRTYTIPGLDMPSYGYLLSTILLSIRKAVITVKEVKERKDDMKINIAQMDVLNDIITTLYHVGKLIHEPFEVTEEVEYALVKLSPKETMVNSEFYANDSLMELLISNGYIGEAKRRTVERGNATKLKVLTEWLLDTSKFANKEHCMREVAKSAMSTIK